MQTYHIRMKEINYPKVLVISVYDYHNGMDATSITLRSFFNHWPTDRICHIHCETYEVLENTNPFGFNLNISDIKFNKILHYLKKKKDNIFDNSLLNNDVVVIKSSSFVSILKQKIKLFFSASADLLSYKISSNLESFILTQNPEVIYVIPSSRRIIRLVIELNKRFSIPIIPHFMDDWPSTIYKDSILFYFQRKLTLNDLNSLLNKCKKALVISKAMEREYTERYLGIKFFTLMNALPTYLGEKNEFIKTNEKISFCYAGGLHLNRWSSLLFICKALKQIANTELIIYTKLSDWNNVSSKFSEYTFIKYGGFLKTNDTLNVLKEHDYLVFVESFDQGVKKYTKLSISTKIPEYLCLGKPIIAIGPSDIASINYFKVNDSALVLDEQNKNLWKKLIVTALNDKHYFDVKIDNSKKIFIENHLQINQERLLKKILSVS